MWEDIKTKKHDFIELQFTGYYDGKPFDSNIEEDLKQINPEAKPDKTIIVIGEKMVVPGLDKALEDKEIGKEYTTHFPYKDAFGERKRDLVKTIPLSVFTKQKINPYPGATFVMDNMMVRIITVSGARVITDFNNPLAGKDLDYKFKITRILSDKDESEKCEAFFKFFLRLDTPNFEIKEKEVILKAPKVYEGFIKVFGEKFKEVMGKELKIEEEKETPTLENKKDDSQEENNKDREKENKNEENSSNE